MAKNEEKKEFVNPLLEGVNYIQFLEAVGKDTVKEYCKGHLTDEQIDCLENDLKHFKQK